MTLWNILMNVLTIIEKKGFVMINLSVAMCFILIRIDTNNQNMQNS